MNHDIVIDFDFAAYVQAVGAAFCGDPKETDYRMYPFNVYAPVSKFKTILGADHSFDPARDRSERLEYPALVLGVDDVHPSAQRSIGNGQQLIDFRMRAFVLYPREAEFGDRDITRDVMKLAAFVYQSRRFGQPVTPAVVLSEESKVGEEISSKSQVQCRSVGWEHTTAVGRDIDTPVFVA